jgi:hypothetical protein
MLNVCLSKTIYYLYFPYFLEYIEIFIYLPILIYSMVKKEEIRNVRI